MLLYYQSWMFYIHFIVILYHFLVLTYWHSAKCCFFHVFYITGINIRRSPNATKLHGDFFDQKEHNGPWLRLRAAPRRAQPTRARQEDQERPGGLCPPRVPPGLPLCSINTPIFPKPLGSWRNIDPATAESRTTRSNLDTISDGVHHLHWCLSDDAWVVLCRPSGP